MTITTIINSNLKVIIVLLQLLLMSLSLLLVVLVIVNDACLYPQTRPYPLVPSSRLHSIHHHILSFSLSQAVYLFLCLSLLRQKAAHLETGSVLRFLPSRQFFLATVVKCQCLLNRKCRVCYKKKRNSMKTTPYVKCHETTVVNLCYANTFLIDFSCVFGGGGKHQN